MKYYYSATLTRTLGFAASIVFILLLVSCVNHQGAYIPQPVEQTPGPVKSYSFTKDIQPILNTRCINCHSCYDAPAQLNLSCAGGVTRGATKERIYDAARLLPAQHTRLHVDGQTEADWRNKGFFPVVAEKEVEGSGARLKTTLMYQMIALARLHPLPQNVSVRHLQKITHRPAVAPTIKEFLEYSDKYPHAGMPYMTEPLTDKEFATLSGWLAQGAPMDNQPTVVTPEENKEIAEWEAFLNVDTPKARLVSRYLYEHWFISHLYFADHAGSGFFKLIRSATGPGEPVSLIPTALPTGDPGVERVFYRFIKVHGVMKRKTHIVYPLSQQRKKRMQELFFDTPWELTSQPDYSSSLSVRPFELYADIPARSRYLFLLDDAGYFLRCFIQGPVCKGQVALDGIQDRTLIMFQDPGSDMTAIDPEYLKSINPKIVLPGNIHHLLGYPVSYEMVTIDRNEYINLREKCTDKHKNDAMKPELKNIWHGNTPGQPSLFTIFRHYDTGTIMSGLMGSMPDYIWVMDYSILERMYYLLVANFDVFERAAHQLATRQYFDLLRHESENNFFRFIPASERRDLQAYWYRGIDLMGFRDYQIAPVEIETEIKFVTTNHVAEFTAMICKGMNAETAPSEKLHGTMINAVRTIPAATAKSVQYFPEAVFVRVRESAGPDRVYTIIRDKAHKNVAFMFDELSWREPEKDALQVVKGLVGNYPNLFMDLPAEAMPLFLEELHQADSEDGMRRLILKYGVLRNSSKFWATLDWFQEWDQKRDPIRYGVFDLKHYLVF